MFKYLTEPSERSPNNLGLMIPLKIIMVYRVMRNTYNSIWDNVPRSIDTERAWANLRFSYRYVMGKWFIFFHINSECVVGRAGFEPALNRF